MPINNFVKEGAPGTPDAFEGQKVTYATPAQPKKFGWMRATVYGAIASVGIGSFFETSRNAMMDAGWKAIDTVGAGFDWIGNTLDLHNPSHYIHNVMKDDVRYADLVAKAKRSVLPTEKVQKFNTHFGHEDWRNPAMDLTYFEEDFAGLTTQDIADIRYLRAIEEKERELLQPATRADIGSEAMKLFLGDVERRSKPRTIRTTVEDSNGNNMKNPDGSDVMVDQQIPADNLNSGNLDSIASGFVETIMSLQYMKVEKPVAPVQASQEPENAPTTPKQTSKPLDTNPAVSALD